MKLEMSAVKAATAVKFGRLGLKVQKHSPEILTAVGVVGLGVSAVMIVRATLKSTSVVETFKEEKELLKVNRHKIDDSLYNKALVQTHIKAGVGFAKNFGPAVTTGLASVACLLGAQGIMKKRNLAYAAAYKTLEESYDKYRDRVRLELGEEQEYEVYRNISEKEVTDDEGNKEIVKFQKDPNDYSGYARIFDETNPNWSKEKEYNLMFLQAQQNFANDKLHSRGHVFLNDVYDALGMPRTSAGQVVGWVLNGENSDNFVDFGIFDVNNELARDFVNGYESGIVLDFNVDGMVHDLI